MLYDVSILIVNWNGGAVLENCLRSLPAALGPLSAEIWVIDNASSDGSAARVRQQFPNVQIQVNTVNSGFAVANNQAARQAQGRYFLLLNPDTRLPPLSILALWRLAEDDPTVGVLGPRLNNADGSFQRSCWRGYPGLSMALSDALYLWKIPQLPLARQTEFMPDRLSKPIEVDHLLGACLFVRRETWEQVGGLDERFFIFLEETDWCYRAKQAGWRVVYNPTVTITHLGQHSVSQDPKRNLPEFYRSYCQFYRKHRSCAPAKLAMLKTTILMAAILRVALWQIRSMRWPATLTAYTRAMQTGYGRVVRDLPSL
jgi:N-acetylglucosaminyl-diphospho-decaprenol L-rhamnosyltransferase